MEIQDIVDDIIGFVEEFVDENGDPKYKK